MGTVILLLKKKVYKKYNLRQNAEKLCSTRQKVKNMCNLFLIASVQLFKNLKIHIFKNIKIKIAFKQ